MHGNNENVAALIDPVAEQLYSEIPIDTENTRGWELPSTARSQRLAQDMRMVILWLLIYLRSWPRSDRIHQHRGSYLEKRLPLRQ